MKPEIKTVLIIAGSVLVLTAIGIGIWLLTKEDKPEDETSNNKGNDKGNNDDKGGETNSDNTEVKPTVDPTMVVPKYNAENELSNDYSELKGKTLYPKRKEAGGWGYANVRSSAEVNTDHAWWDGLDNLLTTINSGTPIGKVTGHAVGVYNGYSYTWFKVRLFKATGFWGSTYDGYVRADTVTIKPYKR